VLSKNKIKYIQSLKDKKGRAEHGVFVAEGNKMVTEFLAILPCRLLLAQPEYLSQDPPLQGVEELVEVTGEELCKASFLKTPQQVLGVFVIPSCPFENIDLAQALILMLDGIQDPGNLGTIIRLADWYGIEHILCSPDTVDPFNPKVVQATMGALARVKLHYMDLPQWLAAHSGIPVYGTFLDGENIYEQVLSHNGVIVMGNEGNGVRPEVAKYIHRRLFVPSFPPSRQSSESLNVAVATAIVCAEFRRRVHGH
jgi:TrmH family RNA methyltransferase